MANRIPLLWFLCLFLLLDSPAPLRAQEKPVVSIPNSAKNASISLSAGVRKEDCFPIERLPTRLRQKAEKMLLDLLDSEALFSIVGGMKPMSSGFAHYRISVEKLEVKELEDARQILATFHCGEEITAELLPFHSTDQGKRYFEAVVFCRPALREAIGHYQSFFAPFGITPSTDPMSVVITVEHDSTTGRNRGLGYLYGYPSHAVDFFVESAEEQKRTGKFVERDFVQIPVFKGPTGHFVYAVPRGYQLTTTDLDIKEKAGKILAAYRERRSRYIGEGKPGPAALLRDWLDNGQGRCMPENAAF